MVYLIYKGYKNTEIANELQLSEKTVRDYVSKVYKKLHTNNRDKIREYVTPILNEEELKIHPQSLSDGEPTFTKLSFWMINFKLEVISSTKEF
ncbi:response regulator transcription factor [Virgibacillus proomii]|uniref:response regulator transcription factor n=1 Tax=Virgibacillus proomii TaxID=84407 RepID=UPI001C1011E3|nr:LuxR C-terminal-related transcriptional regulator [Virgibacillus proomii]